MSQPETDPEDISISPDENGTGRTRQQEQEDLRGRHFPLGDWAEPAERLEELYRWTEEGALATIEWYLSDRRWKRRGARALRLSAGVLAAVGAGLPLLEVSGVIGGGAAWGLLALLLAAACLGMDRCFGLTSGWMRDMATAQAVQRRLETLQFDWSSENVREVLGPTEGTASEAAERCLNVLRRFNEDMAELVRAETSDWMSEFRAPGPGTGHLYAPAAHWPSRPAEGSGLAAQRFPLPPGSRPNMPRQRPPEPPR
ncbi:SLATT domain-containing protein [Streptomyces sp. NPDC059506]|uniref:SLATT domain-containing protein n=1 Tax=Streptomyces TaxID=1883 RepID=UPI0036BC83F4